MKKKFLNDKGFSLMEVAILILVMGIFSVIAIPRIDATIAGVRTDAAAQKIANDIRYARELALSHHNIYGIEFDTSTNSYQVFEWNGSSKTVVEDPHTAGQMIIDFDTKSEYAGVSLTSASPAEIRISAFGVPLDSSDAALTSTSSIVVGNGASTLTIQVEDETGFTEIV